jgi:toxin CcdB
MGWCRGSRADVAQYDIYLNPQPNSRATVPYVVDVQSGLIDQLPTRFVMPLSRVGVEQAKLPTSLCPLFEVDGESLSLMPHLAAPVPARLLKKPVGSVAHRAGEVSAAIDAVISGF